MEMDATGLLGDVATVGVGCEGDVQRRVHAAGQRLMATVEELGEMDAVELKRCYKQQLRKPREDGSRGAGLGLIDMARKSCQPLQSNLTPLSDQQSFFCITATI